MTTWQQILFWALAAVVLAGIIVLFKSILLPFVLGAFIAYMLNPMVNKLTSHGMKRRRVVLGILCSFIVIFTLVIAIISPILFKEMMNFVEHAPEIFQKLWAMAKPHIHWIQSKFGYEISVDEVQDAVKENVGKALQVSKGLVSSLTSGGIAIIDAIVTILVTPIVAYFLLKDWPRFIGQITSLLPVHYKSTIKSLSNQIDQKIAGFIRGQITVCAILGMMYAIALSIAGLNYGFLIGLGTGVLSIIPYVGSTIGLITSLGVAFLQSDGDWGYVGIIAAIFATGQFLEGNFITPRLMGNSVGLHPLWILFALMAGGSLLGVLGMMLSIPVAAAIGVLLGFLIEQYKKSPYYKPELEEEEPQPSLIIMPPHHDHD